MLYTRSSCRQTPIGLKVT
ncbi:hypothetical protein VTL71DRAFT_10775 [Oculimacula yallundae]|uniref:Uncharacterized protein n=1 Tax=Oculimacula yallundae TaxID=86028 RepID=A0ABR4CU24_9HELO